MRRLLLAVLLIGSLLSLPMAARAGDDHREAVLIRCSKPYTWVVSRIEALGGKVTYQYEHVDAIAAEIPLGALGFIRGMVGPNAITKDTIVPAPAPVNTLLGKERFVQGPGEEPLEAEEVQVLEGEELTRFVADPRTFGMKTSLKPSMNFCGSPNRKSLIVRPTSLTTDVNAFVSFSPIVVSESPKTSTISLKVCLTLPRNAINMPIGRASFPRTFPITLRLPLKPPAALLPAFMGLALCFLVAQVWRLASGQG